MDRVFNWVFGTYAVLLIPGLLLGFAIKRRYLTSLYDIPGPFVASFSSLWQVYQLWKGHTELEMIDLHRKHGKAYSRNKDHCNSAYTVSQETLSGYPKRRSALLILTP